MASTTLKELRALWKRHKEIQAEMRAATPLRTKQIQKEGRDNWAALTAALDSLLD